MEWQLWLIIGLALLLMATLEGAYRMRKSFDKKINELLSDLTKPSMEVKPKRKLTDRR